ncbi:carboxylesterase/lipase family protein [Ktedonospora formicarum]|uniref:Carboxylic ester hydrolase n=1 Tax=Ktedonospora formicarum TaxID=2778364 RepID=A0A8J3HWA9_9CHLR|nr:carboxylesterase family protein [Ktedonospora formicarum]GHO42195.1 carboxylic ester hydrolase [Ktedonospora formicarum]
MDNNLVVSTSSGRFRGHIEGRVTSYLGIPYAQPPVGALRFRAPQPFQATRGVVDAYRFGAASIQTIPPFVAWIYPPQDQQSEDCLTLNVWTPPWDGTLRPVIVWLHGGAFRTGATRMPLMNGRALAEHGVVVVTVNYRLGTFGLLAHPDFADPDNGSWANWQLQDMGAALHWVRQNIAAFGGDPARMCLMGQSGGAMSAAILAQNAAYRSCFQMAVLLSPPTLSAPVSMTQEDAAAYTELLASSLATTPRGLRNVPARTLHEAELTLNLQPLPAHFTSGQDFKLAPLLDSIFYLSDWTRTTWPADIAVIITYTLDEGAFFYNLYDQATHTRLTPPVPSTRDMLAAMVLPLVGGSLDAVAAVINVYTRAAVAEGRSSAPADLWVDIAGDRMLRNYGTRYATTIAKNGASIRYATYMHQVKAPGRGVPHCSDMPMIFGTYGLDYYRDKVGAGPEEARLSHDMMSALVSFTRDTIPTIASGLEWPVYQPGAATSVHWGTGDSSDTTIGPIPRLAQLAVWDAILGY